MEFHGLEKLSLVDFDKKVSCTLFTGACNFRCPFCHNSSLVLNIDLPVVSNEEIFKYLKSRVGIIDAVTITGGEPTLHNDLKDFIVEIKKLGYLVKLDTNGTNPDLIKELIDDGLIDYIAIDIKNSKEKYALTCGLKSLDISNIEKSIILLKENKIPYEFRTTIVKEFHTKKDIEDIAKWLEGAQKYRLQKFIPSENCLVKNLHEVNKNDALEFLSVARKFILDTELRSY